MTLPVPAPLGWAPFAGVTRGKSARGPASTRAPASDRPSRGTQDGLESHTRARTVGGTVRVAPPGTASGLQCSGSPSPISHSSCPCPHPVSAHPIPNSLLFLSSMFCALPQTQLLPLPASGLPGPRRRPSECCFGQAGRTETARGAQNPLRPLALGPCPQLRRSCPLPSEHSVRQAPLRTAGRSGAGPASARRWGGAGRGRTRQPV